MLSLTVLSIMPNRAKFLVKNSTELRCWLPKPTTPLWWFRNVYMRLMCACVCVCVNKCGGNTYIAPGATFIDIFSITFQIWYSIDTITIFYTCCDSSLDPDCLWKLSLQTLCFRRLRGDMIKTDKLLKDINDSSLPALTTPMKRSATHGHSLRLLKERAGSTIKAHSFTHRIVNDWNSLPIGKTCWRVYLDHAFKPHCTIDPFHKVFP